MDQLERLGVFRRAVGTLDLAAWLALLGLPFCAAFAAVTLLTCGFGLVLGLPFLAVAGVLWIASVFVAWFGKFQCWLGSDDRAGRLLAGMSLLADPLLGVGFVPAVSRRLEPVTAVVLGLMLLAISLGGVILAVQRRARRLNLTAASRRLGLVLIRTGLLAAVAIGGFIGVRLYPAAVPLGLRNLFTYAGVLTLPWYVGDGKLALTMLRRELPE